MKSMPMMARLFCRVHFLLLATGLNVNGSMAANTTSKLVCDTIQAGEDPAMLLDGRHITIGLYVAFELNCNSRPARVFGSIEASSRPVNVG